VPHYGEGLIGRFEDPRTVDRVLEMEERRLYQMVHTVAEVRALDGDPPLGDERDDILVPQVDKLAASATDGVQGATPPGLTPFGQPPPTPGEPDEPEEDEPDEDEPDVESLRNEELAKWRRKALKRGADVAFSPDYLPADLVQVVKARLALAEDEHEVKAAFSGPFLVKAERITFNGLQDPFASEKDSAERKVERIMRRRLAEQLDTIMRKLGSKPDMSKLPSDFWEKQAAEMQRELRPEIEGLARTVTEAMIASG